MSIYDWTTLNFVFWENLAKVDFRIFGKFGGLTDAGICGERKWVKMADYCRGQQGKSRESGLSGDSGTGVRSWVLWRAAGRGGFGCFSRWQLWLTDMITGDLDTFSCPARSFAEQKGYLRGRRFCSVFRRWFFGGEGRGGEL